MKDAGMSDAQILQSGTSAAGIYFKDKDVFGTVSTGSRADLILLDADPRITIANISKQSGVMAAGRWYSAQTIQEKLKEIEDRHKR